jgi:long-chain acyl-CoA synthetase
MQDFHVYINRINGNRNCAGVMRLEGLPVKWYTCGEVYNMALTVGASLLELGINPGDRIGVFCENRLESVIFLVAANLYGFIVVFALYSSLITAPTFVFKDAGVSVLFVSTSRIGRIEDLISSTLKFLIVDEIISDSNRFPCAARMQQYLMSHLLREQRHASLPQIDPEQPCTICYSSGTINAPKGVIISHRAVLQACWNVLCAVHVNEETLHVSYLPIAHILERLTLLCIMFRGGRIAFGLQGCASAFDDMKALRATSGPIIPSMLQELRKKVLEKAKSSLLNRFLFSFSMTLARTTRFFGFRSRLADFFFFARVKETIGGKIEWFVVAGDVFDKGVHEELSIVFGIQLIPIYGSSECVGAVSISNPYQIEPGTVGCLAPNTCVKFSDRGEIMVKSSTMFTDYWNMPGLKEESFVDGWYRTGDSGCVDCYGNLIVKGRCCDIVEFVHGFQLAIPFLVLAYSKYCIVADIFIHPCMDVECLVAVVVTTEKWVSYGMQVEADSSRLAELAKSEVFGDWVRKGLRMHARVEKIPSRAYISSVRCRLEPFRNDPELFTATGKQRNTAFQAKFGKEIESMKKQVRNRRQRKGLTMDMIEYDDETSN